MACRTRVSAGARARSNRKKVQNRGVLLTQGWSASPPRNERNTTSLSNHGAHVRARAAAQYINVVVKSYVENLATMRWNLVVYRERRCVYRGYDRNSYVLFPVAESRISHECVYRQKEGRAQALYIYRFAPDIF